MKAGINKSIQNKGFILSAPDNIFKTNLALLPYLSDMKNIGKIYLILSFLCIISCSKNKSLFKKIEASDSGISFNNNIVENDSINPIDLEFLYNGGGVAVGDFNNDGLPDLYFTASTVSNKLYINKGDLKFKDVTVESGTTGENMWCSSASVVDINNDGLEDIYVCTSIKKDPLMRRNLLYINKGVATGKDYPTFQESAKEYGLADTSFSVVAAFAEKAEGALPVAAITMTFWRTNSVASSGNRS